MSTILRLVSVGRNWLTCDSGSSRQRPRSSKLRLQTDCPRGKRQRGFSRCITVLLAKMTGDCRRRKGRVGVEEVELGGRPSDNVPVSDTAKNHLHLQYLSITTSPHIRGMLLDNLRRSTYYHCWIWWATEWWARNKYFQHCLYRSDGLCEDTCDCIVE